VRIVADALIQSWQLEPSCRASLFRRTIRRIQYYQRRNAHARKSHTKTTVRKLHRAGIKLAHLPRCDENTS
jgi:hypothetical protein